MKAIMDLDNFLRDYEDDAPGPGVPAPPSRRRVLTIRVPDDVYDALKARAREQHRSMQGQVLRLIETDVRRAKKETP